MTLNTDKIDDAALALLYLTLHDNYRAWKGMDWDVLGRLHDKGPWSSRRRACSGPGSCSRRCSEVRPEPGRRVRRMG